MTDMNTIERSRIMSDQDLALLGMQHIAYLKPVATDGGTAYSIHAADGTRIALMDDRDLALAAILQHDMQPVALN